MKVILREDIPDIGRAGEVVEVKGGYGRNYLVPRKMAVEATRGNLKAIDEIKLQKELRDRKQRREAEVVKEKIEKLSLTTEVLVGDEEQVFGSVGVHDIVRMLANEGISIGKNAVQLENPIKVLGVYTVPIKVDKELTANLQLFVVKKTS